jgi:hypothetical protein
MLRLILTAGVLGTLAFAGSAESRGAAGTWTADLKDRGSDEIQMSMKADHDGNMGMGFDRADFTGLTLDEVRSDAAVPVRFELRRDAGTIEFEGSFRNGRGRGAYRFLPNPEYPQLLSRLGVHVESKRGDEARELMGLAMFDVSTEFIRSMQAIGYRVDLDKYVAFRIFKVDPEYVRAMAKVGFDHLSADRLVETKVHNVSPEYIREMRASGENLTLDELIQSRIFQVTPEFADEMRRAGYAGLERETLVAFKIHGVTPEFIRSLRPLGYDHVPADQLIAMRIHGVTPEFIRRVEAAGHRKVPIDKLVQMRIFDIDPEMVGALDKD